MSWLSGDGVVEVRRAVVDVAVQGDGDLAELAVVRVSSGSRPARCRRRGTRRGREDQGAGGRVVDVSLGHDVEGHHDARRGRSLGHGAVRAAEDVREAGRRVEGRRHRQGVEADRREERLVDRVLGERLVRIEARRLVAGLAAAGRHGVPRPAGDRIDVAAVAEELRDVGEVLVAVEVGEGEAEAVPAELEAGAVLDARWSCPTGRAGGSRRRGRRRGSRGRSGPEAADRPRGARRARRTRPGRSAGTGRSSSPARGARR